MKRARTSGGSVTGGTGDVKPQIFTIFTQNIAANTYGADRQPLPVPRFGTTKTKATIMEILKVYWYLGPEDSSDVNNTKFAYLSTSSVRLTGDGATNVTLAGDMQDSHTFAFVTEEKTLFGLAGGWVNDTPNVADLTDDNGNGVLIATDQIFITGGDVGGTLACSFIAKILYRLVSVGVTEYVGIVQSQQ